MKTTNKLYLSLLLLPCIVTLSAQNSYQKATETQKKEITDNIRRIAREIKTLKADFTQVKELSFMKDQVTSEGKMLYKPDDKIRWEYTRPYAYVFAMDGNNVRMTSGGKTNKIPVKGSKLFTEISRVMIGGVSGSGLIDSPDFTTQFMVGKSDCKIMLTPRKKEVKDLFSSIQLYVDRSDSRIRRVELIEKSGDKTIITLKNIQLNTPVDDSVFAH
ncbi:MAG: outer membrane lipoprotein carrier protein LolA [Tannerella forsythia]|uniref:LolA family protein n=1 Tax=Tannerella forsythia TaxID=28112 RepID=UPI0036215F21